MAAPLLGSAATTIIFASNSTAVNRLCHYGGIRHALSAGNLPSASRRDRNFTGTSPPYLRLHAAAATTPSLRHRSFAPTSRLCRHGRSGLWSRRLVTGLTSYFAR